MKTVYFVRHAKSSWDDASARDHDRVLNDRGMRDAPRMARFLVERGERIDFLLSSTATRAKSTAEAFQEAFDLDPENFWTDEDLYHASPTDILSCMSQIPNELRNVAIFGHNPGMTILAGQISPSEIENVPTCGVFKVTTTQRWDRLHVDDFIFEDMWIPKKHLR